MELDSDFVISELEKASTEIVVMANDVKIVCPFHMDTNPSCSVHTSGHKMPVGTFHCWSCGEKGHWGKLAERLGLDGGEHHHPDNLGMTRYKAQKRREEADVAARRSSWQGRMPAGHEPWKHGSFRELPEDFLVTVGARRFYDDKSDCWRIIFPVKNHKGIIKGSTARRLDKDKFMPWLNSPGVWASTVLYPLLLLPAGVTTVVLVEGPYDALRLNYYGIPTLSILGTANWNLHKISAIEGLGVQNIIICMDGDTPGRRAESQIFHDLDGRMPRKRFRLPIDVDDPIDPGNMDIEKIAALKELAGY